MTGPSLPRPVPAHRATLEDVARAAGVSRQTVSNALNAPHLLRPDTLARVTAAVDDLAYRPNAAARAMRLGSSLEPVGGPEPAGVTSAARRHGAVGGSRIVAVRAGGVGGDDFVGAVARAAARHDRVVVALPPGSATDEAAALERLAGGVGLGGVVLVADADTPDDDPRLVWLAAHRARAVLVGPASGTAASPGVDRPGPARVEIDVVAGMTPLLQRLLDLGHRRIALLDDDTSPVSTAAHRAWWRALERAELGADDLHVPVPADVEGTRAAVARLLARPSRPSALVATSTTVAVAACGEVAAWGLTPGDDVAVVGWGDGPAARAWDLAVVAVPTEDVVEHCVDLLVDRAPTDPAAAGRPDGEVTVHRLVPTLVARRTLGAPAA